MGCGGSRETGNEQVNVPLDDQPQRAPRPQTAQNRPRTSKSRPGTRSLANPPPSRQHRPGSKQSSGQRPHSSSHRPHPSGHRPHSSSHRPHSSSHRPQSQHQRGNLKRQSRTPHPILEEQPPEDSVIHHEINTLSTLIDQHAQNYYSPHSEAGNIPITMFVRRHIGRTIINDIIDGSMDGTVSLLRLLVSPFYPSSRLNCMQQPRQ